jgi:hypothetical protein
MPQVSARAASSFVNRVSPANVGGMALNARYLQKCGIDTSAGVAAVGVNRLIGTRDSSPAYAPPGTNGKSGLRCGYACPAKTSARTGAAAQPRVTNTAGGFRRWEWALVDHRPSASGLTRQRRS